MELPLKMISKLWNEWEKEFNINDLTESRKLLKDNIKQKEKCSMKNRDQKIYYVATV